jgi:hypothetical protein
VSSIIPDELETFCSLIMKKKKTEKSSHSAFHKGCGQLLAISLCKSFDSSLPVFLQYIPDSPLSIQLL